MNKIAVYYSRFLRCCITLHVDQLTGDGALSVSSCFDKQTMVGMRCDWSDFSVMYVRLYLAKTNSCKRSEQLGTVCRTLGSTRLFHWATPVSTEFEMKWRELQHDYNDFEDEHFYARSFDSIAAPEMPHETASVERIKNVPKEAPLLRSNLSNWHSVQTTHTNSKASSATAEK